MKSLPPIIAGHSQAWAPDEQFEALRSALFARYGLMRLVKADHVQGRMRWSFSLALGTQASFGSFEGDALQAQRPPRTNPAAEEAFILTWLRNGCIVQEAPCGAQRQAQPGQLNLYDSTQPMRFHRSAMHGLNLVLPRRSVLQALQGRTPASGPLALPAASLSPFLCAQLELLERLGPALPAASLASALDAAGQLALACLREASDLPAHTREEDGPYTGLLAAARQYMQRHLQRHDLDAERIAAAVHSSRARLYRGFASQNSSVGAELREMRLQAARTRLERSAEPIGQLAWHCGFASASTFSRMFRTRFGASPQEWRAQYPG